MLGLLLGGALLLAVGGCRTPIPAPTASLSYFAAPAPDDAWSRKIRGWQQRERVGPRAPRRSARSRRASTRRERGSLRDEVRRVPRRAEAPARERSRAAGSRSSRATTTSPTAPVDHWATFEETFRTNGDDCDGLELLAFHFLRELGFRDDEVFRAIVVRPSDGQHHMVTLWFETPNDPWVIDPTGAMTTGHAAHVGGAGLEAAQGVQREARLHRRAAPRAHTAQR